MSFEELQKLWKCSEKLALQNTKRLCEFTPADAVTPAVLAYEGSNTNTSHRHLF
mgnify:FL=1